MDNPIAIDDLITQSLDKLIEITDLLCYPSNFKKAIKYLVATDFQNSIQFDDSKNSMSYLKYISDPENAAYLNVETTNGIHNYQQLNRYIHEFTSSLKYVRKKSLDDIFFPEELMFIDFRPSTRVTFRDVSQFTFLKKYDLNFITDSDMDFFSKSVLGSNFPYHINEHAKRYNKPNPINIIRSLIQKEEQTIYQVEELEYLLSIEAANRHHEIEKRNLRRDYDPEYFNNFVKEQLFHLYEKRLSEKITSMNEEEALRYLEISCNQFISHDPDSRIHDIADKFWSIYLFPSKPTSMMENSYFKYLTQAIDAYKLNFEKFKNITELAFTEYKSKSSLYSKPGEERTLNQMIDAQIMHDILHRKKSEPTYFDYTEYYNQWLTCTVTLSQWQDHVGYDMMIQLREFPISEEEWEQILNHQFTLYNQSVEIRFTSQFKRKFEQLNSENDKLLIAQRDLSLINDIIIRNIDNNKEQLLRSLFFAKDWKKTADQFEYLLRDSFASDNNHNIHHADCFAHAESLIKYRKYLSEYINEYESKLNSTNKGRSKEVKSSKVIPLAYTYKNMPTNGSAVAGLFNSLKNSGFLTDKTDIKDFKNIFSNNKPERPIFWYGTLEELAYFVRLLHNDFSLIVRMPKDIWKVTAQLFLDEFEKPYIWTKFRGQKIPARAVQLENAVRKLL